MQYLTTSLEHFFAGGFLIFLRVHVKRGQIPADCGCRIGLIDQGLASADDFREIAHGCNPSVGGGMGQLPFIDMAIGQVLITEGYFLNQFAVTYRFIVKVAAAETHHGGQGISFVWKGKIRIVGEGLSATRAFPSAKQSTAFGVS
jgi:hypothetical protein